MEQEQLKMLFLYGYNLKIVIQWRGVGREIFYMGDMSEFTAGGGDSPHLLSNQNPVLLTFAPESFWILFYLPKVILKMYLDGKLQVTLAYYLYYKRDFSYCQTLWLFKGQTIFTDFENNCMLWNNH